FDQARFERYIAGEKIEAKKQEDGSYLLKTTSEYHANTQSDGCPNGFNQEETIKKIFLDPNNGVTK
ncbi:MAG: hypothetical protein IJD11_03370, partial [Oscillospiraceae bacterium]|nr:hypothetical protein [Oscillospiraceae bacterium]